MLFFIRYTIFLPKRPKNPKIGNSAGENIKLNSNIFKIDVHLDKIHQYQVEFDPFISENQNFEREKAMSEIERDLSRTLIKYFFYKTI